MRRLLFILGVCAAMTAGSSSLVVAGFDEGIAASHRGDYATALKEFRVLAKRGHAEAQYYLGLMYHWGHHGVVQDYNEAVKWYRKAAEQGYAKAQDTLGLMYHEGHGVVQDYNEALKWFRKAAEQGYTIAQFSLGLMYREGQGVVQDYVQAHKWFNIASANGSKSGSENRNIIAKQMTSADISKAQKLAREWIQNHQK